MPKSSLALSAIILALLFSTAFAQQLPQVEAKRDFNGTIAPGGTIEISLNLKFRGEKPSGIIITEFPPKGWEITGSFPTGTKFKDKYSWLFYGDKVKDQKITYLLKAPADFNKPVQLSGAWQTLQAMDFIQGETVLNPSQAQAQEQGQAVQGQDNSILLYIWAGIIMILLIVLISAAFRKNPPEKP